MVGTDRRNFIPTRSRIELECVGPCARTRLLSILRGHTPMSTVSRVSSVVLQGITWQQYVDLRDREENNHVRMTYDRGDLELMLREFRAACRQIAGEPK